MFKQIEPQTGFPDQDLWLFIGAPKSGKSTFFAKSVSSDASVAVIDTQSGYLRHGGLVLDVRAEVEAGTYESPTEALRKSIVWARENKPDWFVVDTLDDVYSWFEKDVIRECSTKLKQNFKEVGEIPHGGGWGLTRQKMLGFVTTLRALPCNVALVAHCKRLIDEERGSVTKVLDLPGKLAIWLPGEVDHIGITFKERDKEGGSKYLVSFEGYEQANAVTQAGSRHAELNDKTLPLDYSEIKGAYNA